MTSPGQLRPVPAGGTLRGRRGGEGGQEPGAWQAGLAFWGHSRGDRLLGEGILRLQGNRSNTEEGTLMQMLDAVRATPPGHTWLLEPLQSWEGGRGRKQGCQGLTPAGMCCSRGSKKARVEFPCSLAQPWSAWLSGD